MIISTKKIKIREWRLRSVNTNNVDIGPLHIVTFLHFVLFLLGLISFFFLICCNSTGYFLYWIYLNIFKLWIHGCLYINKFLIILIVERFQMNNNIICQRIIIHPINVHMKFYHFHIMEIIEGRWSIKSFKKFYLLFNDKLSNL